MSSFVDLDTIESRARACVDSGYGLIEPSVVLELIARLRAAESAPGAVREIPFTPRSAVEVLADPPRLAAPNAFENAFGSAPDFPEETAEACSCDEAKGLRAKLALYERAEPNGAIMRLGKAINRLTERHNGDAIREALDATEELKRFLVATEIGAALALKKLRARTAELEAAALKANAQLAKWLQVGRLIEGMPAVRRVVDDAMRKAGIDG